MATIDFTRFYSYSLLWFSSITLMLNTAVAIIIFSVDFSSIRIIYVIVNYSQLLTAFILKEFVSCDNIFREMGN